MHKAYYKVDFEHAKILDVIFSDESLLSSITKLNDTCFHIDGQNYLESSEDHIKDVVHRLYTALHMDEYQVRHSKL